MKKIILFTCCFGVFFSLRAQDYQYKNYDWDKVPVTYTPTADEMRENAIGLKDKRAIEFVYDQHGELETYYTYHRIVKIINESAIEDFNKVYVPVRDANEIIELKARSISKEGVVKEVDKNNIKKIENLEDKGAYQIFAVEGLEAGSEVEYFYTLQYGGVYYGHEIVQSNYPRKNVELEIISPPNLVYLTKSYNGFPELNADSTLSPKNRLYVKDNYVPGLKDEQYASYTSNLMRVEYTLGMNLEKNRARVLNWSQAGDTYFNAFNPGDQKELNDVKKFLQKANINGNDDKKKIFALDDYLKQNIAVKEENNPDFSDLRKIVVNKYANEDGMLRLYIASLAVMGYNWELVMTTDRLTKHFDGDFESWNYLSNYLIYLPDQDIYLAPTEEYARNGLIPSGWTDNDGLFIKKISIGDASRGLAKVKHIPAPDFSQSRDDLFITFNFDGTFDELHGHLKHEISGYNAQYFQPFYELLPDDSKDKLFDGLLKFMGEDTKVTNIKVSNEMNSDVSNHPFIIESDIAVSSLIENAGNKYLFKVGDAIGPQDQMYNAEKRENPIENTYNRGYHREITFNIPDGYTINNLNDINKDVALTENGEESCYFHSHYSVDGSTVKITINEDYKKINFTTDQFADFQKVINASADFNKVVLVMQKKS